jgi:cell division ATPase FtsA
MPKNIRVGIDIGTYQVKVAVVEMALNDDGKRNPKIIATGLSESKGLRHGYIINTEEVSESVSIAIRKAEKICGYKITKAFISMGGTVLFLVGQEL